MRWFRDTASSQQVGWLAVHSALAVGLGGAMVRVGYDCLMYNRASLRNAVGTAGAGLAVVAGAILLLACALRLLRPFRAKGMDVPLAEIAAVEAMLVFLSSLVLAGSSPPFLTLPPMPVWQTGFPGRV